MRVLIADDEELARQRLVRLLEAFPDLEVVAQAEDGEQVLPLVHSSLPDLLFLDIQMPHRTGLEVARLLLQLSNPPWVIFLTAYSEHALDAFELQAEDYLVKPVKPERLAKAIDRVRQLRNQSEIQDLLKRLSPSAPSGPQRIALLNSDKEVRKVAEVDQVELFFTRDDRNFARMQGLDYSLSTTLAELEKTLPAESFFRTHRCFLVNLRFVDRIEPWFHGAYNIFLKDGSEVALTRRKVAAFREKIHWL